MKATNENDDEEDDDDEEENEKAEQECNDPAIASAKGVAIFNIGIIAKEIGTAFAPYVEQSWAILTSNFDSPSDVIREAVVFALPLLVSVVHQCTTKPDATVSKETLGLTSQLIPQFMEAVEEEYEREVTLKIFDSISFLCKEVGLAAIHPHIDQVGTAMLLVLKGKSACQLNQEDEVQDVDEEDDDKDLGLTIFFEKNVTDF